MEEAKAQVLHHLCWRRLPHGPLHHCHCLHHIHITINRINRINRLVKHDDKYAWSLISMDQGACEV